MGRKYFSRSLVVLLSLFIWSCASGPYAGRTASSIKGCTGYNDPSCIKLVLLNIEWDPKNPLMAGLDKPHGGDQAERRRRVGLGPKFSRALREGAAKASSPMVYKILVWGDKSYKDYPTSSLRAYDSTGTVPFREVNPDASVFIETRLVQGNPGRVFYVQADRGKVVFQFPSGMIQEGTYILVCPSGRRTVYPNRITRQEGLWLTSEFLNWAVEGQHRTLTMPFLSMSKLGMM